MIFSVIIPTHNRANTIARAVESVLNQNFTDYELIVVDDGSKDKTRDVLKNYPVQYFYQYNSGVCAARNQGASLASGEYLIFLDSDDWLLPNTLAGFHAVILKTKAYLVLGSISFFDEHNRLSHTHEAVISNGKYSQGLPGSFAIRKAMFAKLNGYDLNLAYSENSDLFLRIREVIPQGDVSIVSGVGVGKPKNNAAERRTRYSEKKTKSLKYFNDKHAHYLASSKKDFINFKRIFAIAALQTGSLKEARSAFGAVLAKDPRQVRSWMHYLLCIFAPGLLRQYYER